MKVTCFNLLNRSTFALPMQDVGLTETAPAMQPAPAEALIRRLEINDLPAVIKIERRSFPAPWSSAMFLSELTRPAAQCFAAVAGGDLVGYLVSSKLGDVWHLNNIAVDAVHRRRGIGSLLVRSLLSRVGENAGVTLEVRPSNGSAITLYQRLGFREAGRRKAYYPDNREDAVIMWRNLPADIPSLPRQ